jgi:hypothetical protein
VRSTVFIEVKARYRLDGPEEMRPVGEVEFVDGLATESARGTYGRPQLAAAIIGYADLKRGERVAPVLDAAGGQPRLVSRGVAEFFMSLPRPIWRSRLVACGSRPATVPSAPQSPWRH